MKSRKFTKPQIPSHFYIWCEPPDSSGEETLHFVSQRRTIKLKGRAFADFDRRVIPLLNGCYTQEEISRQVEDVFAPDDLASALGVLAANNLLQEGDADAWNAVEEHRRLIPQLNLLHELGFDAIEAQQHLQNATVSILGMSGAGPALAESLANTGIGHLRLIDSLPVSSQDQYWSQAFRARPSEISRAKAVQERLARQFPASAISAETDPLTSDEQVAAAVKGSDYIACCLDVGQSSIFYKLNRICLQTKTRWTSCTLAGTEVHIGPTIYPGFTPCYLCYKMRAVSCSSNPEDAFAFEQLLDNRKQDDSSRRENLAIGASLAANFLALEIIRDLSGLTPVPTAGKLVIFNLLDLSSAKHVILRKPWCPACFPSDVTEHTPAPADYALEHS